MEQTHRSHRQSAMPGGEGGRLTLSWGCKALGQCLDLFSCLPSCVRFLCSSRVPAVAEVRVTSLRSESTLACTCKRLPGMEAASWVGAQQQPSRQALLWVAASATRPENQEGGLCFGPCSLSF